MEMYSTKNPDEVPEDVQLALNEARKKCVNWAEENKFYDEDVLKEDMKDEENQETNYQPFIKKKEESYERFFLDSNNSNLVNSN